MIHPPKILDRVKAVNLMQNILVMPSAFALFFLLVVTKRVNIPKGPSLPKVSIKFLLLTHHESRSFPARLLPTGHRLLAPLLAEDFHSLPILAYFPPSWVLAKAPFQIQFYYPFHGVFFIII